MTVLVLSIITFLIFVAASGDLVKCRDPDVGGTSQNKERKFMIIGSEDTGGGGIGNLLIFFPAAFYFAAVTGRDIIITDNSAMGEMCNIIHCGFPFSSQLALAYPKIVNTDSLTHAENLKSGDFIKYMEGKRQIDSLVVKSAGYQSKSDWWVWFNTSVKCISKITGCDLGDVMCAERHAYQRLVRGPFRAGFTEKEEQRIRGVPDNIKHALLTLPHSYAPRLDMAIHLRTQFYHFEQQANVADPAFQKEVSDWLNSTECADVFAAMENKVMERAKELRPTTDPADTTTSTDPVYVYLASDNQQVKDVLHDRLLRQSYPCEVKIMKVETNSIYHVKNFQKFQKETNNEGLLDLVFDWYALSLANQIYAWRKDSTAVISTFVHSAQKVSGTTERSDNANGMGLGTRGYQLTRNRRGHMVFSHFWGYSFMDDYQKP